MEEIMKNNIDKETVKSFGDEWSRFNQSGMTDQETLKIFDDYFSIFPWKDLPHNAEGFDMGCGSGRWAKLVAPKVGHLNCIDPSSAIRVAKSNLSSYSNTSFYEASLDNSPLKPSSQDFGYSLGVLHHVPDTKQAIQSCTDLLKPGAPLLLYLYYSFDGRPLWFRSIWKASDIIRRVIFHLHPTLKHLITNIIAALIYLPIARFSGLLSALGISVNNIPLSYYRHTSFYTMRTDARDRFGTPLEQRFSKPQIQSMMEAAGLEKISFSSNAPYWCAIGYAHKANNHQD
jgi:SAM-dependent methyltransferase